MDDQAADKFIEELSMSSIRRANVMYAAEDGIISYEQAFSALVAINEGEQ